MFFCLFFIQTLFSPFATTASRTDARAVTSQVISTNPSSIDTSSAPASIASSKAVKAGGADPDTNSKLYDIVQKAKANNMPNDNITRSIKKASGELSAVDYFEIMYEGYGIGGSAVIVECLTDNKNRYVQHTLELYQTIAIQSNRRLREPTHFSGHKIQPFCHYGIAYRRKSADI